MYSSNPRSKSPTENKTSSEQQERNDWFLRLCDPTSVECDEILEHRLELGNGGSRFSNIGHDFSCEDLCSICGCDVCRSVKPRSRSEDTKRADPEEVRTHRCNSAEPIGEKSTPRAISSSCHSRSCSQSNSERSFSPFHSAGEDSPAINLCLSPARKTKRCRRNTLSYGCELGCGDSTDIPPPMALIDVNRLSLQNLAAPSKVSGARKTSPRRCPTNCFMSRGPAVEAPKLQLQSNLSLDSSGTGSWCGADDTSNRPGGNEPTPPADSSSALRLRAPLPHLMDSSARDSGFSSHSSNSANFPVWQCQTESTSTGVTTRSISAIASQFASSSTEPGRIPPPVPPHAPHSFAANAAAAVASSEKRELIYTPKLPCCNSARTSVIESACGSQFDSLTLRLTPFSLMRKEIGDFHKTGAKSSRDMPDILTAHRSDSPVWKQSQQSISEMLPPATSTQRSVLTKNNNSTVLADPNKSLGPRNGLCLRCMNARRYFLEWAQSSPGDGKGAIQTVQDKSVAQNCPTCRQHILNVGVNLFNRDPLHGLLFLNRHRVVNMNDPQNMAQFILCTPGLCRSRVGAFLGLPRCGTLVPIDVMRCLLERFDFHEMEVDEALRLVVHHFGIPVESQEIDRFLECLASRYHETRFASTGAVDPSLSENQVLLLLYSILLLQTSLYNKNAVNSTMGRQTVSQFIRNCQNLSSNSRRSSACTETSSNCTPQAPQNHPMLSESALNEIYQRIKAKPLTPGSDHTQLVKRISSRLTLPKTTRNCGCQWTAEKQWMQLFSRLFEPHRRFVCLCTMIQFVLRPRSFSKVALLRYVLLFNDMLILTKHEKPYRGSSRHRLRASDQQQIRRGLLTLLRNNPTGTGSKTLNRLLASYLQPPIALFRLAEGPDFPLHDSYHLRLNELVCIPQVSVNNKSTMREPGLISRRKQTGKLLVLKMIPLNGCRLRLFQTEDCRFGLELWKLMPPVVAPESCNQLPSSSDSGKLTLVATLATLTENDYENFLGDLIGCLRESHTVLREVQAGRA